MDASGDQVSDLDDVEIYWEKDQLDMEAVFSPGIGTPFLPTVFDDLEIGGSTGKPILLDKKEDKEKFPPTTLVSERPTRPPAMLRSCPFGARVGIVPDYVDRKFVQ